MPKKKIKIAPRPALPPRPQNASVQDAKAFADQVVLALNGALNQTSSVVQRRMEEGFRRIEKLIASKTP